KLHCIKDFAPAGTEMINGGNIRVANSGSGSRLAEKAPARQFFLKQSQIENLQCYRDAEIQIDRLKGDTHGAVPQLLEAAIRTNKNFVVTKLSWACFWGTNLGLINAFLMH